MTTFQEMMDGEEPTDLLMKRLASGIERGEEVALTQTEQLFVMMHLAQSFSAGGLAKDQPLVMKMIAIMTEQFIVRYLPEFRYYVGKVKKKADS